MEIIHIQLTVEGVTPLILNRFSDEAQKSATDGTSSATNGDRGTPQDQAAKRLYWSADNKLLVVPASNLLACITEGGKYFKNGKKQVTTQKYSLIPAVATIEGVDIRIEHKQPWRVDARPIRIPATGGRLICYRPIFDDWKLSCRIMLDTSAISAALFRQIVDMAGSRVGLGDYRPDRKGPFGRFVVTIWKIETRAKVA